MSLSLDTNVFVDLLRARHPGVRRRFQEALLQGPPVRAALIVLHELRFGAEGHAHPGIQRERVAMILSQVRVEPFEARDMMVAARLRADLKRRGRPIGPYDLLIAGQALARGWSVVTANASEFSRVEGLEVIDWTEAA